MNRIIGTYTYTSYANKEKIQKIKQILTEYRKTAKNIAKLQWNYFFKNNTFNKNLDIKNLKSALSERYKQTCQWQVVSILESFIQNVKNEFEKIVYNSKLDNKTKKVLLAINKQNRWFDKNIDRVYWINKKQTTEYQVNEKEKLLAKKILKHILNKWKKPRFKNISMHLDSKEVLRVLVKQYFERLKGCNSASLEVLKGNPYFRDFLEDFLNPRMVENKCL